MLTKADAKQIAKDELHRAIGCAYYRIADDERISQEDAELIIEYINKYGKTACKSFGTEYVSY